MRGGRLLPKFVSIDSQITYVGQGSVGDVPSLDENDDDQNLNINIYLPKSIVTNSS
jgi:hypothetical protein